MTKQEEPSVLGVAELWARMEQIRKEHREVGNQSVNSFYEGKDKKQELARLEAEHLAVLEALGVADDALFDPFEDVPRPTSVQQARMGDVNGIEPPHKPAVQASPDAAPRRKSRCDLLKPIIEKAVEECGQDHTLVFGLLRQWANQQPPRQPLRGVTEKGIQWVNAQDEAKELTINALKQRLERRR